MLNRVERLIREYGMLPRGSRVLVALSGGPDSVGLLMALYRLRPVLGFELAAAHYNHGLRGPEAYRDEVFCGQLVQLCCGAQTLPDGTVLPPVKLFVGRGDVITEAQRNKAGMEETARAMRYTFLRQIAREQGCDKIATAHTADDNAETILLHLARGTGLQGLTGIHPAGEELIRPMLTCTKGEIERWLWDNSVPFVIDSTNSNQAYARNRIRQQVTPVLEELYPGFSRRLTDTTQRLWQDEQYLSDQARTLSAQAEPIQNGLSVPANLLADAPEPIALRAVRQLLTCLRDGDDTCAAPHLEAVVALCRNSAPSAQTDLPDGLLARREYDKLTLLRDTPPADLEAKRLTMPGESQTGDWTIRCTVEEYAGEPQSGSECWLSREKAPSLWVRPRRTGDRLRLPGRPGKSLKKWMVDEKIPRPLRQTLPVLTVGEQVAAVAGLGPDQALLPERGEPSWHIVFISAEMTDDERAEQELSCDLLFPC